MFDINPQVMGLTRREAERQAMAPQGRFHGWLVRWLRQARLVLGLF